ncbi:MAG: hypothetical protein QM498_14295 [Desulfobacterium sp.]
MDKLDAIFSSESIAVIGASSQKGKVSLSAMVKNHSEIKALGINSLFVHAGGGTTVADIIITLAPPLE